MPGIGVQVGKGVKVGRAKINVGAEVTSICVPVGNGVCVALAMEVNKQWSAFGPQPQFEQSEYPTIQATGLVELEWETLSLKMARRRQAQTGLTPR